VGQHHITVISSLSTRLIGQQKAVQPALVVNTDMLVVMLNLAQCSTDDSVK